jgi:DNA-binding NtrC family response regulator
MRPKAMNSPIINNNSSCHELLGLKQLVGESAALLNALKHIPVAAQCDVTVLISGETGTGKELVARAIHYQSARHGKPFIPVNCGALPDHLFENEFFGHAKGAFTDASTATKGLVAEAEGGTLFLDEIDALTPAAQIKLLRFLQDREYRPLGSASALVANVRVIAATNADLARNVENQTFRQDLYYRLKPFPIVIPPLRERMEDVPLLAEHFINLFATQHMMPARQISASALQKLHRYHWPGNIRELECTIQQAVLISTSAILEPEDVNLPEPTPIANHSFLQNLKADTVNEVERDYLLKILSSHKGNITHAARAAGKERRSFQRLLRKHGIERGAFVSPAY